MRRDGRAHDELRKVSITRKFTENPGGSVLMEIGKTVILCTAMIEDGVPPFLINSGQGWLTAEYSMLPGSTPSRKNRDGRKGAVDGRSVEIQRLIGRSLRAIVDLKALPNMTVWVDCDVLQADGGTRTASITGAYVALHDAFRDAERRGVLKRWPLQAAVGAISVGIVENDLRLDLSAHEDARADVDMNVVRTSRGEFVEIQGSAEKGTFGKDALDRMVELASHGITQLHQAQEQVIGSE